MECKFLSALLYILVSFIRPSFVSATLEDQYIEVYGNNSKNPNVGWSLMESLAKDGFLEQACIGIHKDAGKGHIQGVNYASLQQGTLKFVSAHARESLHKHITFVKYKPNNSRTFYYITNGLNQCSVFYLLLTNKERSEFVISEHVANCSVLSQYERQILIYYERPNHTRIP